MANIENRSPLRFVLDENVPLEVAGWLRDRRPGWEVFHVLELGFQGNSDLEIFQWAQANRCIVITFDRDFPDRRNLGTASHCGIVHLRVRPTTIEQTTAALDRLITQTEEADLNGAVVVVGRRNIRVRRPGDPSD